MDPNIMALLKTVLSGAQAPLSGQSPISRQAPAAAPMQAPMMAQPQQPMVQQGNQPYRPTPMMAGEQPDHGGPGGFPDPNNNGGGNGGKDGDGKGGGKADNNQRLSDLEKLMRKIGNKGPKAYTPAIKKNLEFGKPTIGYGGGDPSTFKSGMASILSGVPSGPINPAPPVETGDFPTWPKV